MRTVVILIAAVMITFSGLGAFAAERPYQATLANPVKASNFVSGELAWRCQDASCATTSLISGQGPLSSCKALVRKVGPVVSFADLDAAGIDKCNGHNSK